MAVFSSVADGGCEPSYFRLMCVGRLESEECDCDWGSDCDCRCDGATTGDGLVVLSMTNDELLGGMRDIYYGTLLRLFRHRPSVSALDSPFPAMFCPWLRDGRTV